MANETPLLGVCLGHQTIAAAFGASIVRAAEPMHGRSSAVWHDGRGLFCGVPNPLIAGRYHSLVVAEATLPSELQVTARTADGTVMAIRHRVLPIAGLQFHPESILTECGYELLAGFLRIAGGRRDATELSLRDELMVRPEPSAALPNVPVTF